MPRIAVIVPGGMGSILNKGNRTIWEEDFKRNYQRILADPDYLKWRRGQRPADAAILKTIRFLFFKKEIWARLYDDIFSSGEFERPESRIEFGYDWRDDVIRSGKRMVVAIGKRVKDSFPPFYRFKLAPQYALRFAPPPGVPKLVFVTHSMGATVVRATIGSGTLDPRWIDRIIHVAPALVGVPLMFRALYEETTLPLLKELLWIRYLPNGKKFHRAFLASIRTFPSAFQMLPLTSNHYVRDSHGSRFNPLDEDCIPAFMRTKAARAHGRLAQASLILKNAGVRVYSIYTDPHNHLGKKTELQYVAEQRRDPKCRYKIEDVHERNRHGDSVVPAYSAKPAETAATRVENVDHETMCDYKRVVRAVQRYL